MRKITTAVSLFCCFSMGWAQSVPPCTLEITDAEAFGEWTVIDANSDVSPNTWIYNDADALYPQDMSNAADDWIVSPAVSLEAGKAYEVSAYVKHDGYMSDEQRIELKVGNAPTVEAMTAEIFRNESFSSFLYSEESGTFSPIESGVYYIGLHCYSASYMGDLYFQKIVIEEAAVYPAQVSDLSASVGEKGELAATLSWTWPSTDHLGGTLSNLSGAKIYRESDLIATLDTATVGGKAVWTDSGIEEAGKYTYEVVAYNTFGDAQGSAASVTSSWVGNDTPAAVTELTATADGETVRLMFTPPTEGENGGYIDVDALTYEIERAPGGILEESFSGALPYVDNITELGSYVYTVTVLFNGERGESAESNKVVAGGAVDVPYSESFDTESSLDLFTIINANYDGSTWKYYSSEELVQFWGGDDADEWLILPKLNLVAGKNYKLLFKTGLENAATESHYKDLRVTIGQAATVEAQTTQLFQETIQSALMDEKEVVFSVPESGGYYIGFHCYGNTSYCAIFIDDISIDETEIVPAEVSDLAVIPGEKGALSAEVTWTNPSLSAAGTPLPALTKVELYRGEELIYTHDAPELGGSERVSDENIPAAGKYEYKVVGYTDGNAGKAAVVESSWIGNDTPRAVTDVVLSTVEGKPQLTFKAPAGGVNDGYIDIEGLRYRIVRNPGEEVLTESLTDTVYIDEDELALAMYSYTVTALCGELESEAVVSNAMKFGEALSLPYETEMETSAEMDLWTVVDANKDGRSWEYDEDDHEMAYTAYSAADDWLFTPPFKATEGSHTLSFRVRAFAYRYPESMEVTLSRDTVPGESQQVIDSYTEINSTLPDLYTVDFEVPSEGVWYVGFHVTTEDPWGLYISTCSIISNVISGIDEMPLGGKLYFDRNREALILGETGDVQVVSSAGATVVVRRQASEQLDLSQLPAGFYIARFKTVGGEIYQVKFVK